MKVGYMPGDDGGNLYTARMKAFLGGYGTVSGVSGGMELLKLVMRCGVHNFDYLLLNWTENKIVGPNGRISFIGCLKLFAELLLAKISSRKVFYVRHNWFPHAAVPESSRLARWIVDIYERCFDSVLIHSGDAKAIKGRHYCPHPLYEKVAVADVSGPEPFLGQEYYAVFGRIVAYKRIEALMRLFPAHKNLLVFGLPRDRDYANTLMALQRKNIVVLSRYFSEEEAQQLVTKAKAVIVSHADADMVVSGSFFYALTLRKPILAVETPFLKWVEKEASGRGVLVYDGVESLARGVGSDCQAGEWSEEYIEHHFGDDAVRASLSSVLGRAS